eukprot:SAG31_NODE_2231_length_6144_cov_3.142763_2_plen_89_part_00
MVISLVGILDEWEIIRLKELWFVFDQFRNELLPRDPKEPLDAPKMQYLCRDGYVTTNEFGVLLAVYDILDHSVDSQQIDRTKFDAMRC